MDEYKKISLIISDIDGVWTDGSIYKGNDNMEFKKFSVFDGVGVAYARAAELKIAIISARYSPATEFRAKELKIDDCYNGGLNKLHAYNDLKKKYSLSDDQIAYLGDDMVDLPVMELVGLPIAVQPKLQLRRSMAHFGIIPLRDAVKKFKQLDKPLL